MINQEQVITAPETTLAGGETQVFITPRGLTVESPSGSSSGLSYLALPSTLRDRVRSAVLSVLRYATSSAYKGEPTEDLISKMNDELAQGQSESRNVEVYPISNDDLSEDYHDKHRQAVPRDQLVGIEPNPGPPKKAPKQKKESKQQKAQIRNQVAQLSLQDMRSIVKREATNVAKRDFRVSSHSVSDFSKYAAALIAPMECGQGVGVPDEYAEKTMRFQSITEVTLTGNTTFNGILVGFDGGGFCNVVTTPHLEDNIWLSCGITANEAFYFPDFMYEGGSLRNQRCVTSFEKSFTPRQFMTMGFTVTNTLFSSYPLTLGYTQDVDSAFRTKALLPAQFGNGLVGLYFPTGSVLVTRFFLGYIAAATNLQVNAVWSNGVTTTLTTTTASAAAATYTQVNLTAPANAIALHAVYFSSSTANVIEILRVSPALFYPASVALSSIGTGVIPSGITVCSFPPAELATFSDGTTRGFRLVSQSTWCQYDGGTLNNSGRIVGQQVNDRSPIAQVYYPLAISTTAAPTGVRSYVRQRDLATLKNCYDGQMPMGVYAYWLPKSHMDFAFRSLGQQWDWTQPYTSIVLQQSTVAGQNVRLQVVSNWEILTNSNLYILQDSVVDPSEVARVFELFREMPCVMENEFHFAKIADFLRGVASKAKGVFDNVIKPIAESVPGMALRSAVPGLGAVYNVASAIRKEL
jgi:hypothetical protein